MFHSNSSLFQVTENPFQETVQGLVMLDDYIIVYSVINWVVLDLNGKEVTRSSDIDTMGIVTIAANNTKHVNIIRCSLENSSILKLVTKFYEKEFTLNFHTAFCFNKNLSIFIACQDQPNFKICMYDLTKKGWTMIRNLTVSEKPLMLSLGMLFIN